MKWSKDGKTLVLDSVHGLKDVPDPILDKIMDDPEMSIFIPITQAPRKKPRLRVVEKKGER